MHAASSCMHAGYAIDVTLPSMRIAIEADGPSHFSRTPHTPRPGAATPAVLGPTAMKRRHLKALGWTVISVKWQVSTF
jgi:very-short-patch-repair endonuclease